MNTRELQSKFPQAFKALPSCYQNDSCLEFSIDSEGYVHAFPLQDQIAILGDWESMFKHGQWKTVDW